MIRHIYVKKAGDTRVTFENTGYIPGTHDVRLFVKKSPIDELPYADWTPFLTLDTDGSITLDVPEISSNTQLVYDIEISNAGKKNYPYRGVVWSHP